MPGSFYITGLIVTSNTGRSYRVFALDDSGERVFIGLVSKKVLAALLQKQISQADVCKFTSIAAQEPFSLELKA